MMSIETELQKMELRKDAAGPLLRVWNYAEISRFTMDYPALGTIVVAQGVAMTLQPIRVMISSLEPGQKVDPHTDNYDGVRMHYPLTAVVHWWDEEEGDRVLPFRSWSYVNARIQHSVENPTQIQRITLIVDFV